MGVAARVVDGIASRLRTYRGRGLRNSVILLAGSAAAGQALTAAAAPLLTRLYSPADLGELSVYVAILSLVVPIASLRYQMAIPLPNDGGDAIRILELCIVLLLAAAIIVAVVISGWEPITNTQLASPLLSEHWWLLSLGVVGAGGYQAATYWGIRQQAYSTIAVSRVQQSIAQVSVQLSLGVIRAGSMGLVVGYMVSQAVGIRNLLLSAWEMRQRSARPSLMQLAAVARRYRKFALYGVPSAVMINAAFSATPLMLGSAYGLQTVGYFALTQRVMALPMRLVGQAIGQAYMGTAAKMLHTTPSALPSLFAKSSRELAQLGAVTLLPVGIVAPYVFTILFGNEWREAGVYVQLLTPMFLVQLIVSPLSQTSMLLERQDLELIGSTVRFLSVVGIFSYATFADWNARAAVVGYSAVMTLTYCGFFFFYRWLSTQAVVQGIGKGGPGAPTG